MKIVPKFINLWRRCQEQYFYFRVAYRQIVKMGWNNWMNEPDWMVQRCAHFSIAELYERCEDEDVVDDMALMINSAKDEWKLRKRKRNKERIKHG